MRSDTRYGRLSYATEKRVTPIGRSNSSAAEIRFRYGRRVFASQTTNGLRLPLFRKTASPTFRSKTFSSRTNFGFRLRNLFSYAKGSNSKGL